MVDFVATVIMLAFAFSLGYLCGQVTTEEAIMQEAAGRGYAEECVGKIGYYWECKDE